MEDSTFQYAVFAAQTGQDRLRLAALFFAGLLTYKEAAGALEADGVAQTFTFLVRAKGNVDSALARGAVL